ncbi:MAG: ThuA domain-containing protein [Spirochaetales bacterium]|nr:ThuA domain-containing protein [Spirochaetales bacterium]
MKKALILGNYSNAAYHPFAGVDRRLTGILSVDFSVVTKEDRSILSSPSLGEFDLIISYADDWERSLPDDRMGGLMSHVSSGGGILVIHNGISFQGRPEFAQLIGARFVTHPPRTLLTYTYGPIPHPVTDGLLPFRLFEEPYRFIFSPLAVLTVILETAPYPAGWVRQFGKGRVAYLAPGHEEEIFTDHAYKALIRRTARWTACIL